MRGRGLEVEPILPHSIACMAEFGKLRIGSRLF